MQMLRAAFRLILALSLPMTALGAPGQAPAIVGLLGHSPETLASEVEVAGYYAAGQPGGGLFQWDAACGRASHNGGTIISPSVPWDGQPGATHLAFLKGEGESAAAPPGCWKRAPSTTMHFAKWGGRGDWDGKTGTNNQPIWLRMRAAIEPYGATVLFDPGYANDYWFGDTVVVGRDNVELVIPKGVTARSTRPTSQGSLFSFGKVWYRVSPEPAAVRNVGMSGGGTVITESPGDNENTIALSKVHGGWVRGMYLPDSNRKAVTMQYDYEDIVVENNRIGRTGHDAITVQGLFEAAAGQPAAPHRRVRILNNIIESAGRHGFLAQRNAAAVMSDIEVRGNSVAHAGSRGFAFNGVDHLVIVGNVVHAANVGVWLHGCAHVTGDVGNDAIRDDGRSGNAHLGHLRLTGTTGAFTYRAMSMGAMATPLVIDRMESSSSRDLNRQFRTDRKRMIPTVREQAR